MTNFYQNPYAMNTQANYSRLMQMRTDIDEALKNYSIQPQMAPIQQTFIQTPPMSYQNDFNAKWVASYDEAKSTNVPQPTIFMNKEQPEFYMKQPDGTMKSYKFIEIPSPEEAKDLKIKELEETIAKLQKKEVKTNGKSTNASNE